MAEGPAASSHQLMASGALTNSSPNVSAGSSITSGGNSGMMGYLGDASIDAICSDGLDSTIKVAGMDEMVQALNQEGGAFGKDIVQTAGAVANHMGASEAKGDNLDVKGLMSDTQNTQIGQLTTEAIPKAIDVGNTQGGAQQGG